ncbi:MAG TPA: peptidoglycan-associated lipoprotein Pal [Gemmatimonadaceae bacterium]|nr:peptidoglycan-associated lipoprotein Pal [Gemmatimonadaceae bacterium]
MNRTTRVAPAMLVVLATAAVVACGKKQPPPPPAPAPGPNQDSIAAARARQDSIARAEQARQDSIARAERARQDSIARAAAATAQAKRVIAQPIYFAFDSDVLSDSAQASLDQKLAVLNANSGLQLRVEGNTDARGSDEYNLALGQRRAAAAKRYLTQHGVDDSRITIISYGEERPAAQGADESAYAQNRRDEFSITAGGDQLTAPPSP